MCVKIQKSIGNCWQSNPPVIGGEIMDLPTATFMVLLIGLFLQINGIKKK